MPRKPLLRNKKIRRAQSLDSENPLLTNELGVSISRGQQRPCKVVGVAPIAQSVERLHGKEKVYGSIPYWGSTGLTTQSSPAGPTQMC